MSPRTNRCYVVGGNALATVAFVPHPAFRGVWIRTDPSVVFEGCPQCGSGVGTPCRDDMEVNGQIKWKVGVCYSRKKRYYAGDARTSARGRRGSVLIVDTARFSSGGVDDEEIS